MYLNKIRCASFPVGEGSIQMNYANTEYYLKQLSQLGTATLSTTTAQEKAFINQSKVPSHTEMVAKLAPEGDPDAIILAYWMPDLDTSVGNALVTTICAMYDTNVKETIALSENGPGIFFSALEYAQRALARGEYQEIWLFYLNQFQGGSAKDERIFWHEAGKGVWLKLTNNQGQSTLPKLAVSRCPAGTHHNNEIDLSASWEDVAKHIDALESINQGEKLHYRHYNEHSSLVMDLHSKY
jgi:CheY-like chemotaxis protein